MKCQPCLAEFVADPKPREFRDGSIHHEVHCPNCRKFVRWLSQGGPLRLYFGKHKGEVLAEVAAFDREYCEWLLSQVWLKPKLRTAILEVLK
jgi:hypothetical protein